MGIWVAVVDRTKNNRSIHKLFKGQYQINTVPRHSRTSLTFQVACHLLVTNAHFLKIILVDDLQKTQRYPLWVVCF